MGNGRVSGGIENCGLDMFGSWTWDWQLFAALMLSGRRIAEQEIAVASVKSASNPVDFLQSALGYLRRRFGGEIRR